MEARLSYKGSKCIEDGCGRFAEKRGLCNKHYKTYRRHGWELPDGLHEEHGMKNTITYRSWGAMIQRCTNPNNPGYAAYGGKGIAVHPAWRSFVSFLEDMGERPSLEHSLDRYPNRRGNYEPGNCRWATRSEQNSNQDLRTDNKSGIKGVKRDNGYWRAQGSEDGVREHLYKGNDFFEACCARKSWEQKHGK